MGDAKRRGTFEQRRAEAVQRQMERLRNAKVAYPRSSLKTTALMAGIAGIMAGRGYMREPLDYLQRGKSYGK